MNANHPEVTLQINLAPTDLPHAEYILPHQLRQWGAQVAEILLVLDLRRSRGPRSAAWEERLPGLRLLVDECCSRYANAHWVHVDYSPETAQNVASTFFGGHTVPAKDWNGTAVYPYFFGIFAAKHDYVFHMDSDMLYGGGSTTWVMEAVELLTQRPDVLICSPLPGPPTADGHLRSQTLPRDSHDSLAFLAASRDDAFSTRLFLIDRNRFSSRIGQVRMIRPSRYKVCRALAEGNPPYELAEVMLSRAMAAHGLARVDFLGRPPGMWSVHPPYRSKLFYDSLPRLIERIEAGDIPELQRGDHDVNDSMVDWSSARKPLWRRVGSHANLLVRNMIGASD